MDADALLHEGLRRARHQPAGVLLLSAAFAGDRWLRRIRGAVGLGLLWALVWAPVSVLIGLVVDPDGSMDEMWVAIGAYAGFLGGLAFAVVLGIVGRRRRFEELSLSRFAAWGAVAGLLVGALPAVLGGLAGGGPAWVLSGVIIGSITLLSAVSAAGSLALARRAERRALTARSADTPTSRNPA